MLLEIQVGSALPATDAAGVGFGRGDEALALEDVQAMALTALLEDPLGEVDEGVAVGVGGDLDDASEELGSAAEGDGGLVRGPAGGLVIEVPEDHHRLLAGGPDAVAAAEHVHLGSRSAKIGGLGGGGEGAGGSGAGAEGEPRYGAAEREERRDDERGWAEWEVDGGGRTKHLPPIKSVNRRDDVLHPVQASDAWLEVRSCGKGRDTPNRTGHVLKAQSGPG